MLPAKLDNTDLSIYKVEDWARGLIELAHSPGFLEEKLEALARGSAIEEYLAKRKLAEPIITSLRHLECGIGEELGPAPDPRDSKRTDLDPSLASEGSDVDKDSRRRFRLIAEHWDLIEPHLPCSRAEALRIAEAARKANQEKPPEDFTVEAWALASEDARQRALAWDGRSPQFNKQERRNAKGEIEEVDSIEWAKWSWNPVTGCLHNCPYCYARDIANHFTNAFPDGFSPAFRPSRLNAPVHTQVPREAENDLGWRNVFVCSMADLFGRWVPEEWIRAVLSRVEANPQWNFLFLTKFPIRLAEFDFPDNAWVGTTVDCQARVANAEQSFRRVNAKVKWLSVEPMLEPLHFSDIGAFQWVVIGGASGSTQTPEWHPPRTWSDDLRRAAEAEGCMVYEKTNLLERIRDYPGHARGSDRRLPKPLAYIPSIAG